jgi:hypothetical protein
MNSEDTEDDYRCSICKKEIKDGEARYTGEERRGIFKHWDCHEAQRKQLDVDLDLISDTLFDLTGRKPRKPKARDGDGPTAQKIKRMIVEAFERDYGLELDINQMVAWVQPPAYRGPRMDLAVWGIDVPHPDYPNRKIIFHSWDTMTALAKQKTVEFSKEGIDTFDVG